MHKPSKTFRIKVFSPDGKQQISRLYLAPKSRRFDESRRRCLIDETLANLKRELPNEAYRAVRINREQVNFVV